MTEFRDKMSAAILLEMPSVSFVSGIKYVYRRDGQGSPTASRVVFVPHKLDGTRGAFLPPIQIHRAPDDVGIRRRWVAFECWAYNSSSPTDPMVQDEALECMMQVVWRNAQKIVRANFHVTPNGQVPGIYQIEDKAEVTPTERVHGARATMQFWIDFSVRDIAPTTLDEPDVDVSAELEP
jgi:hypothetical protein